jgi:CheY-like chemotaxis protein
MIEPFYGSQQSDQNSGLGLSLSYATVRSWGGDLAIQSEPGAGTRVSVVLPRAAGDEPVVAGSQAPLPTRKARVLVVDDEPAILRSLARVLGEHEVVTSSSAHEALAILQQDETFDVVLCDLMMPGVTGADLHRTIRSLRPGLEDRFVFMTGGVITPSVERFVSETSCSFVAKPFDTKALRALVAERLASEES